MPCFCPVDNFGVVEVLAVVAGLALVLVSASDAVSTLVTTRRRRGRHWPTQVFYRRTWHAWVTAARRATPELREGFLAVYGPLSLLGLLVTWVVLLVAGWGAVWWGLRSAVTGVDGYLDAVYFAGVGFFTVGFGDLVPTGGLARLLVLVEAFMGLVTMALVIGYLPTLYNAYSRREVQLLSLDDMSDEATTPIGFLEACYTAGGAQEVASAFADWERWCDEVFDSHTAYPMLAMFRSRQPGQNWLTALGVVLDAATICLAAVDGPRAGPAARLWRRASRMLQSMRGMPGVQRRAATPGRPAGRRGAVPRGLPAPGRARGAAAPLRAGLGRLRPAARRLPPRAGRGHRAAAGAAGVPAPDGQPGHHPLRLTGSTPAIPARRCQAARAAR